MLPVDGSASGHVLGSGQLMCIDDFSHDERVAQAAREHMNLGPAVLVPLGTKGNVHGVLTAGRHQGAMPLAPAATDMLVTFADQAGIALELAEHRRQAEQVAVFEDRDRIARDLHDLVIQRLYATGMSLQGTVPLIASPEVAQRVSLAVDALDETIREIRSSIFALQTRQETKPPGLRARILQVADELTGSLASRRRFSSTAGSTTMCPTTSASTCSASCARRCPTPPATRVPARSRCQVTGRRRACR